MSTRSPGRARILLMVAFAGSCVGLLLLLWAAFGGPVPPGAQAYRLHVTFPEGAQLVPESDVRISGVPVGEVASIGTDRRTGRSDVVLEIRPRFAPVPRDARATLRSTTLLGETYVELSPGNGRGPRVPDGGALAAGRVSGSVDLDQVLRTLDAPTRQALRDGIQSSASALRGRGRDLSAAIGTLSPFARDGGTLLRVLDDHDQAVRRLVRDTGVAVGALSERRGALAGLVTDGERLLAIADRRSAALRASVRALPPFERRARSTIERVSRFQTRADPLVARLAPVARELPPTLADLGRLSPDLRSLFRDLDPLVAASRAGVPALERTTDALRPTLQQLEPTLRETNPAVAFVARHPGELRSFFTNTASALQASSRGADGRRHRYLRLITPLNLENLAGRTRRTSSNRPNAYARPGIFSGLATGLPVLEGRQCARPATDVGSVRALLSLLGTSVSSATPSCEQQTPFVDADGRRQDVPRVPADE
ncbi:MlaD family protein [Patulibacter sp.]|uniref:MlaD family protein n=1 Tax=Patulibacter sp. TaxID=1912859 RepID=UPI002726335C|nr:MlaD family protein [Patulibacter sp.]MDO9408708.1 MlaD family protein [Patulibacter sp.]